MMELLVNRVFPAVLNMSLTASVVIVFVLLARLLLRRAPRIISYALWAVVLFRLLCPVSLSAGFSLLNLVDAPAETATPHTSVVEYIPRETVQRPAVPAAPITGTVTAPAESAAPADPPAAQRRSLDLGTAAALVWAAGIVAMVVHSAVNYRRLRRRLVGVVPLAGNIYLADHIGSPFVMGLLRPRIYLPSALPAGERDYILRHEQHHIRRLDPLVKAVAFGALCIHWFNPLVWLAFFLASRDMEMSCDEAVMNKLGEDVRADYSASLLRLATGRPTVGGTPLAFGEGDTRSRIRNILRWQRPRLWLTVVAAAACVAVIAACAANPRGENTTGEEPPPVHQDGETEDPQAMGQYAGMEAYVNSKLAAETVQYYSNSGEKTAKVTAARIAWLRQTGTLEGLAPEGTLESWTYNTEVQLDVPTEEVVLVGGMTETDGWFDLEGQGGRNVVALRYADGSYDVLYDQVINDDMDFMGYHLTYEEAIYDWYVQDRGLALPLYVEEWTEKSLAHDPAVQGNVPVHRTDGDGWYFYAPVMTWEKAEGYGDTWRSRYGTGSALTVYSHDNQTARQMADYLVSVGWQELAGEVPHVGHWENPVEDYYYDRPEGGCLQVRIEWQTQNLANYPELADEPDLLRLMAESFTVDSAIQAAPAPQQLGDLMGLVEEGDPVTLQLRQSGGTVAAYSQCWDAGNARYYFSGLTEMTWRSGTAPAGAEELPAVTLSLETGWSLTAYGGTETVCLSGPTGEQWLQREGEPDVLGGPYSLLRGWFDEVEFASLDTADSVVIPDVGQTYLEAAGAFAQAWGEAYLRATPGSKFCYTFVQTQVEASEETTEHLREQGEIGEDTYCFYMTTVFVPENEAAEHWSMAGNTGEYTGSDPAVPRGALEHYRCGYITRTPAGWQGQIVGTGW